MNAHKLVEIDGLACVSLIAVKSAIMKTNVADQIERSFVHIIHAIAVKKRKIRARSRDQVSALLQIPAVNRW